MRVLILNQYFYPDLSATAQIMTDLAVDLAARGHTVKVVTGRTGYVGGERYAARESYQGVEIVRVASTGLGRRSLAGRMVDFSSFLASAGLAALRERRVDVLIAMSTPPLLSLVGVGKKLVSRTPFVYWVQDLYPDIAVQLQVLRAGSPVTHLLERLSRISMERADAVIAIGECMAEHLHGKGMNGTVSVIHNWADGSAIYPVPPAENWFRREHGLGDKFVLLYSGNMGRGHRFDTILAMAEQLQDRPDIAFVFVGDGPKRAEIAAAAGRLTNIRLLPYQPREHLAHSLSAADVALVTLEDGVDGLMVPSKIYGHLASGRPVLFIGPNTSSAARIVLEAGCGAVVPHGDSEQAARFVLDMAAAPERARDVGMRGRSMFDRQFDRSVATHAFSAVLQQIAVSPC